MSRRVIAFQFTAISLLALFFCGYGMVFPESDAVTQLLHVLRQMDPHFLPQDWYVNSSTSYSLGYRSIFSVLMARAAGLMTLEWAYFLYYCFGALILPWLGYLIARKGFQSERNAAFLSGLMLFGIHLGSVGNIRLFLSGLKEPIVLGVAAPLSLGVVYLFLRGRVLTGVLAAGTLSLLHPMIGVFTGLYGWAAYVFSYRSPRALPGLLGLLALVLVWRHQPLGGDLSAAQFMEIYLARLPHHYLPSSFPAEEWMSFAFLQVLTAFVLYQTKPLIEKTQWRFALSLCLLILTGCLAGYVFVELIPVKAVLIAQTFRYLYLQSAVVLVLLGIAIYDQAKKFPETMAYLTMAAFIAVFCALKFDSGRGHLALLGLIFTVATLELYGLPPVRRLARGLAVSALALGFLSQTEWKGPLKISGLDQRIHFNWSAEKARAALSTEPQTAEVYRLADFARTHTPQNAVFLTPPTFVSFRLVAERALVVDAKAISFMDPRPWLERMTSAYGFNPREVHGDFWTYLWQKLNLDYAHITPQTIRSVKERFHATHAVLNRETPSAFPVLYQDDVYKIVELK